MTRERAREILGSVGAFSSLRFAFREAGTCPTAVTYPDGITETEDAAIRAKWDAMPGYTCYMDALRELAKD